MSMDLVQECDCDKKNYQQDFVQSPNQLHRTHLVVGLNPVL